MSEGGWVAFLKYIHRIDIDVLCVYSMTGCARVYARVYTRAELNCKLPIVVSLLLRAFSFVLCPTTRRRDSHGIPHTHTHIKSIPISNEIDICARELYIQYMQCVCFMLPIHSFYILYTENINF